MLPQIFCGWSYEEILEIMLSPLPWEDSLKKLLIVSHVLLHWVGFFPFIILIRKILKMCSPCL